MLLKFIKFASVLSLLAVLGSHSIAYAQEAKIAEKLPIEKRGAVESDKLKTTDITADMSAKIEKGKNLVYCSTFQMAWSILCNDIMKGALELSGSPDTAKVLNGIIKLKSCVSDSAATCMTGYGKDKIVEKINKALKDKFGEEAPVVQEKLGDLDIIAYAYLYKNLMFNKEFESIEEPLFFSGGTNEADVMTFGIKKVSAKNGTHEMLKKQVTILYDEANKGFILRLASKSINDEIIISTIPVNETLQKTYESIQDAIAKSKPFKLEANDKLQIPKIEFDILHYYRELMNKKVMNKGFEGYTLTKALQGIKFKLNEKGAVLKSEAKIVLTRNHSGEKGKNFIINGPFIIFLKEKSADRPYFMTYVDNAELLIKK
ncbi:MAG: serpin family protein [Candidatus Wallbacteria bacterium]